MSNRADRMIFVAFADPNMFYHGDLNAQADPARFTIANFIAHAKLAEQAGFDAIFKPDFLGFEVPKKEIRPRSGFEPLTLLTALSQHTARLGLILTASTSFMEPYNVARHFASLDNLSKGRAGWNVVTSYHGERNFGDGALLPLAERYRRADEFLKVTDTLWTGWRDGAVSYVDGRHKFDGNFIDQTNFTGEYFKVEEPLDIPPGPQGRPVIVQAGASDEGLAFAARHAEIVFTATPDLDSGIAFYRDLKQRVVAQGRTASDLKILPGLNIYLGASKQAALDVYQTQFTDKNLLAYREKIVREAPLFKLNELQLDERIPASAIPSVALLQQVERRRSRGLLLRDYLAKPGITLREFLSTVYAFGHLNLIGTATSVAEEIEAWLTQDAADGFVLKGGNSFRAVAEEVVPILREKRLLRTPDGEGLTFREALYR